MLFSEDFEAHILEIAKFEKEPLALTSPLDRWLYFLRNAEHLTADALPESLNQPIIQRAMKELAMLTKDQLERERYEARVKLQRDEISRMLGARLDGRDEGLAEAVINSIHAVQGALGQALTPREDLEKMSLADLRALFQKYTEDIARLGAKAASDSAANSR